MVTGVTFEVTRAAVDAQELSSLKPMTTFHANTKFFDDDAAHGEHYKLLSLLARQCPAGSCLLDIGTYLGHSALALSANPDVQVISYDVEDCLPDANAALSVRHRPNVQLLIKDCCEDFSKRGFLDGVPLVFLDVDPHDGVQEKKILAELINADYDGIILCDDIYCNDQMRAFWNWVGKLGVKRVDLTPFGHWSGTGAVVLHPDSIDIRVFYS